jgi:hypothetical protein
VEYLGACGKARLKCTLKKKDGWVWTRQICLCIDTSAVVNTVMNHRASRKAGEIVDQKIDYKFLKKV